MSTLLTSIRKELANRRWALMSYSAIAFGFILLYVATFPAIQQQSAQLSDIYKTLPKALLQAFNISSTAILTLESYLADKHYGLTWPLMVILLMVSTAGRQIAGEIEKGTMAIQLSLPIGRLRLYTSKYLAGLAMLLVFCVVTILLAIPLAGLFGLAISGLAIWHVFVLSLFLGWAVYSLALMFSALSSERSQVYVGLGGLLMVMYVVNVVAQLVDRLDMLKYLSIFHYYQPGATIAAGHVAGSALVVFSIIAVAATFAGAALFIQRDIQV